LGLFSIIRISGSDKINCKVVFERPPSMPKKTIKEHGKKRLTVNAGLALKDDVIQELAVIYKTQSPALVKGTRGIERGHQRYTRGLLFADLVYGVLDKDDLLQALQAFYKQHIDYFAQLPKQSKPKPGQKKKPNTGAKTFSVDEAFIAPATSLAYKVTGYANLSRLYRVLHYFFAYRNGLLKEPRSSNLKATKSIPMPTAAKPRITLLADPKRDLRDPKSRSEADDDDMPVQVTIQMDAKRGDEIKMLSESFWMKKDPLLMSLIETAEHDRKDELVHFARHKYEYAKKGSPRVSVNFRSTPMLNAVLSKLSFAMLAEDNRSLAASIIINFFAQTAVRKPSIVK
jgi:hypothetical protein